MIFRGVDLRAFALRCHYIFDDALGAQSAYVDKQRWVSEAFFKIQNDRRSPTGGCGRGGPRKAWVRIGKYASLAFALELVMHEMLHVRLETDFARIPFALRKGRKRPSHNMLFQDTLIRAAAIAWDVHASRTEAKASRKVTDRITWLGPDGKPVRVTERKQIIAYALDDLIQARLAALDERGEIDHANGLRFGARRPV